MKGRETEIAPRGGTKFGAFLRQERERRGISLRKFARTVGVSATYISHIERDICPPPIEDKLRKIAEIFSIDADELLARAGKVSADLVEIICENPRDLAALLRATKK